MQKRSRQIMLVLLTSGALLTSVSGCVRARRDYEEDEQQGVTGGGSFYDSSGHGWRRTRVRSWGGGNQRSIGGYNSHNVPRSGFGSGGSSGS